MCARLHLAVREQDVPLVSKLLAAGEDPDEPDWSGLGDPPLLTAASLANTAIVQVLCEAGCDVNVRTVRGETALHLAIAGRRSVPQLVGILMAAGCDPDIQENLQGQTPLHALVRHMVATPDFSLDYLETLSVLAQRSNVNISDHRRRTSLHRLAEAVFCPVQLKAMKILLECGADLGLQSERGETPLHELLEAEGSDVAVALLATGSSALNKQTSYAETPLHVAARKGLAGAVMQLLSCGALPNTRDLRGNTPLHLAAGKGYHDIVRLLIACPTTELNASNKDGLTSLHVAVESGFTPVVEMLLGAESCDVLARTKTCQTALDLARQEYRRRSQPELQLTIVREIQRRQSHEPTPLV